MKELEPLQNAVNSCNLDGLKIHVYLQEDRRKKINKFHLTLKGSSFGPVLNYSEMNLFLLGIWKAKEVFKKTEK